MQLPSSKVVFATLAALATAAALVLAESGIPTGVAGWLQFAGKVLAAAGVVGGTGYTVTENRPPAALVSAIQAGQLPR